MENYKIKLEEEKQILEEELSGLGKKNTETGQWQAVSDDAGATEADESDMDDRGEDYEEKSSLIRVLSKRLTGILVALDKIEGGSYGKCEKCGLDIEVERLEANPSAPTCKNCM